MAGAPTMTIPVKMLEAHPKDVNLRYGVTLDYEDLEIAVGNGVVVGKNSIWLGSATDARTLGDDEGRDVRIKNLDYDVENEVFVEPTKNDPSFRSTSPLRFLEVSEATMISIVRQRFGRSHFATSRNFNKTLKALNTIALEMMVKPPRRMSSKIEENTKYNPFFKDCIGAIDRTHIPAMIKDRDVSNYRNCHGIQSQNVLAACNFDLEFIYVLSGWEGKIFSCIVDLLIAANS
ncbi:hypothetical protein ACLB2K_076580 [Fragaria x ananassa]